MKFHIKEYQTGWSKGWKEAGRSLNLDAHAPSRVVLQVAEAGTIRLSPRVRQGGRATAIPFLNGRKVAYNKDTAVALKAGDKLTLEARLDGGKDQCWNYWLLKGASIMLQSPLMLSFWENAHLGDSLGIMIACENFARVNQVEIHVRNTPLFQAIHELFAFEHVRLVPHASDMLHVHPFGYEFETLGWIRGIAKALHLAAGGIMPDGIMMPTLRRSRNISQEDVVLCQFDGRSGGVWPKQTILDFLKRCHGQRLAVLGGPDTSAYLGDSFEYRLGNLDFLVDQLLSCKQFVGADSGLAHLACILGLEVEIVLSPAVSRKLVHGVFKFYPKPPKLTEVKTTSLQHRSEKRLLLVSTTNGWNLGDDLIRQGVMRLLNVGTFDPVIWLNRAQVNVPDQDRGCSWSPLWKKLRNFGDPRSLVAQAKALVIAGTPEWIDTVQPYYHLAAQMGLPIYIVGVGGGQEGQVHHLKQSHQENPIGAASVRDEAARRAMMWAGVQAHRFLDPAFHADAYEPTSENWVIFNPRLQSKQHREYYADLFRRLREIIDVITVHEQEEYAHACDLFDKPVFFHSDYRPFIQLYRSCSTYVGGRMHGAIPCLASGAKVHLVCHEKKHRECEWLKERLTCPEALTLWEMGTFDPGQIKPARKRFDQRDGIHSDFQLHQTYLARSMSERSC